MAEIHLEIPAEKVQEYVSAAILTGLPQETRDLLIKEAIASLMKPKEKSGGYSYGTQKTVLQDAFDQAVYGAAVGAVRDFMEKDATFKQKLADLIADAVQIVLTEQREATVQGMAGALSAAFAKVVKEY
jgi:hypothetical protein